MANLVDSGKAGAVLDAAAPLKAGKDAERGGQPIQSATSEKFIPVDRSRIVERVLAKVFEPEEKALAADVFTYLCALRQRETAQVIDELFDKYDPFNPDDETVNEGELTEEELKVRLEDIKAQVTDLVLSANYIEINEAQLEAILDEPSSGGFGATVDLEEYDFHLLYYRGAIKDCQMKRSWKWLWLKHEPHYHDAYRRLFLGLKLKPFNRRVEDIMKAKKVSRKKAERIVRRLRSNQVMEVMNENSLHIKVFRRIPRGDMRILFPNAVIRFNLFDRIWLWVGSGGSALYAMAVAAIKIFTALVIGLYFLIITLAGAAAAIVRGVLSFFNTKTRYMARLAQALYFHKLASNQRVLALLADDAEEEDIKEAVLTYAFLLKLGFSDLERVRTEITAFLMREFVQDPMAAPIKFDVDDGIGHLKRFGLLHETTEGERSLLRPQQALTVLKANWVAALENPLCRSARNQC